MIGSAWLRHSPNAAPEWQAGRLGWRSKELVVACPLEGLVRHRPEIVCLHSDRSVRKVASVQKALSESLDWALQKRMTLHDSRIH